MVQPKASSPQHEQGCMGAVSFRNLPAEKSESGPRKWYIDEDKCFSFWAQKRKVIHRAPALHGAILQVDDLLGYGTQRNPETFWGRR